MKKGLAKGLSYTGLQMQDIRRRLLFTEEAHDTLRTRVAKLEEALREIIHESEHTPHSWKERADRNAETARSALKGE